MKEIQVGNGTYRSIKLTLNKMCWGDSKIAVQDGEIFLLSYRIFEVAVSARGEIIGLMI